MRYCKLDVGSGLWSDFGSDIGSDIVVVVVVIDSVSHYKFIARGSVTENIVM
jgi:hypothetical protein